MRITERTIGKVGYLQVKYRHLQVKYGHLQVKYGHLQVKYTSTMKHSNNLTVSSVTYLGLTLAKSSYSNTFQRSTPSLPENLSITLAKTRWYLPLLQTHVIPTTRENLSLNGGKINWLEKKLNETSACVVWTGTPPPWGNLLRGSQPCPSSPAYLRHRVLKLLAVSLGPSFPPG